MIDSDPDLGLPLMYHLMEHGVFDLGPWVSCQVTAADRDLQRLSGPDVHGQLSQAGAHSAGKPDRDLAQRSAEVPDVQLVV